MHAPIAQQNVPRDLVVTAFEQAAQDTDNQDEVTDQAALAVAHLVAPDAAVGWREPTAPPLVRPDDGLVTEEALQRQAALDAPPTVQHHKPVAIPAQGRAVTASGDVSDALPQGHTAQPVWGFLEEDGRFKYAFNHAYGPASASQARGDISVLDQDRCFWSVSWQTLDHHGAEHTTVRWMNFAQARLRWGAALSYSRFSSSIQMRAALPALLLDGVVRSAPQQAV